MKNRSPSSPITSLRPNTPFHPTSCPSNTTTKSSSSSHSFSRSKSYAGFAFTSATTALEPLPPLARDPYHILPVSVPSTPRQSPPLSRRSSQILSPRSSFQAESEDFEPSGSSGRTSFSNSSSGRSTTPYSDCRSSSEEDERIPIFTHNHTPTSWWNSRLGNKNAVSPKILHVPHSHSRLPTPRRLTSSGTSRDWRWFRELFVSDAPETSARVVSRAREREKLILGVTAERSKEESKWWRRIMLFLPTTPWGLVSRISS